MSLRLRIEQLGSGISQLTKKTAKAAAEKSTNIARSTGRFLNEKILQKQPEQKHKAIDLRLLVQKEETVIPQFVIEAVRILKSSQSEGLFRITPDYATLSGLQTELENKGKIESVPLEQLDVHVVAALLKHFYRQLDPRLISESLTLELR